MVAHLGGRLGSFLRRLGWRVGLLPLAHSHLLRRRGRGPGRGCVRARRWRWRARHMQDHLLVVVAAIVPKPHDLGSRTGERVHLQARGAAPVSEHARARAREHGLAPGAGRYARARHSRQARTTSLTLQPRNGHCVVAAHAEATRPLPDLHGDVELLAENCGLLNAAPSGLPTQRRAVTQV